MGLDYSNLCASLARISGTESTDGMWDESKHPRKGGRFAPKGAGETFSKSDALAVHEATAKANWEAMHPNLNTDAPNSELAKNMQKLNTLMKVSKIVKPGASIKGSGIGELHRNEFKRADRVDRRPEYGPTGAKKEYVGWEVRTHPFHQGVVEAFQEIRRQSDAQAKQGGKAEHVPSDYAKRMYAKQTADPHHGTYVVATGNGVPRREVHDMGRSISINQRMPADYMRMDMKHLNAIKKPNLPK